MSINGKDTVYDTNKQLALNKNITLALITTNYVEDNRISKIKIDGDGTKYLTNDGTYKAIATPTIPTKLSDFENDSNYVSLETVQQMIADALNSIKIDSGQITE